MPDASVNSRKKFLFNEIEGLNYLTFDGNILRPYPDIDINYHSDVSPDRQVYFIALHGWLTGQFCSKNDI